MSAFVGGCPHCSHVMDRNTHNPEYGCTVGWEYDDEGMAITDGCECPLTLASLS